MIYLDAAATTPVKQQILELVWPLMARDFGNPSSTHGIGETAARALDYARTTAAGTLGVRTGDIVFTSGGTEANNLAIIGLALANPRGRHVIRSGIEHSSVREACDYLQRHHGFTIDIVPVGPGGLVDPAELTALLREDTTLVTVMAVNNEIGTIQPLPEISAATHAVGALMHADVVQAAGWLPIAELARDLDALSLSGHKLGGMKGAGLAMIRGKLALEPGIHGGGQERGRRSGTENIAGAVSTATALRLAASQVEAFETTRDRTEQLIDTVLDGLNHGRAPGQEAALLTGDRGRRVPGIVSFVFPGANGETILLELERRGVICSSGSACAAGSTDPSPVLLGLGLDPDVARTAVRLSFTAETTEVQLSTAARAVVAAVQAVTDTAPARVVARPEEA
ncbi:MAG: cysteine desulfurase family protein [Arthrobacter sp.]|uniref:cysteine desulfurase family protein n=1 Tax=Arthrobacter sp. AOP36-C1-22 TaxID=3457683 RepID=UPI002656E649|nr:cysteine desulfurase [Micrococcaceae bacterium]MDN5878953.1 cysteine desulfurase [Micrococcaceae bacterium]MDN5887088.1 cysteine desulfurase [Micrococcaceae bacterium]